MYLLGYFNFCLQYKVATNQNSYFMATMYMNAISLTSNNRKRNGVYEIQRAV